MQKGRVAIQPGDIIANLPYNERCSLLFDHHFSNAIRYAVPGLFRIAPSAAGVVYDYYRDRLVQDFSELVRETDKIDAAQLDLDEILNPERHPYVLLSMTIHPHMAEEESYWNHLVALLRDCPIAGVLEDEEVQEHCQAVIKENRTYKTLLESHTSTRRHAAVTDFRALEKTPYGNRFLVYSMFPDTCVSVKIGYEDPDKETVVVKVGHSILNRTCNVNVGQMLSYFEGGGHKGAGACRFHHSRAEDYIPKIIGILLENDPDGGIVVKTERRSTDRRKGRDRRLDGSNGYIEAGHAERRRSTERRSGGEQRKDWERLDRWHSRPIPK